MDLFSSQASLLANHNIFLAYFIVYIATIFFGNIGAFISLWAAFQGVFGLWGVFFVLIAAFCANVTGDMIWYALGRKLRTTRFGYWIKKRFPNHSKFEGHIEQKGPRWMLFAKFAYGSNFPIIFSLGWAQFNFGKFIRRSLFAIAIWLPIILGVSYGLYSTLSPLTAIAMIKHLEILFLIGLISFIILQFVFTNLLINFFDKKLAKYKEDENT